MQDHLESDSLSTIISDTLGNTWRLLPNTGDDSSSNDLHATMTIQRSDCYAKTDWQVVPGPAGARTGAWVGLVTDVAGILWLASRRGLWWLDGRRAALCTLETQRDAPPLTVDYSGLGFDAGFGQWRNDGLRLPSDATVHIVTLRRNVAGVAHVLFSDGSELEAVCWAHAKGARGGSPTDGATLRPTSPQPSWVGTWTEVARLPGGGNHDVVCTVCGDEIFVAGGITHWHGFPADTHLFDELWAYSPRSDTWRVAGRLPQPTTYAGMATLDRKVWIVGGCDDLGPRTHSVQPHDHGYHRALTHTQIFDPSNGSWSMGPPISPRVEGFPGHLALACGGRLYSITAPSSDTHFEEGLIVESISQEDGDTWQAELTPPMKMVQSSGAAIGDMLFAVGQDGFCSFDTVTRTWTRLPNPPTLLTAPYVACHGGELWVLADYTSTACYCWSLTEQCWRKGPEAPANRGWGGAASFEGKLFLMAGATKSDSHKRVLFDDRCFVLNESA